MGYVEKDGAGKAVGGGYKSILVRYLTRKEWNTSCSSLRFILFSWFTLLAYRLHQLTFSKLNILLKPIKGLNNRIVLVRPEVHLAYYLFESRGAQSSVQEQSKHRVIISQNILPASSNLQFKDFLTYRWYYTKVVSSYHFLNPDVILASIISCGRKIFN